MSKIGLMGPEVPVYAGLLVIIACLLWVKWRKRRSVKPIKGSPSTAGYVYVISNEGSFGKDVFKVGMTRRENPMVRIHELSDASVPFPFTVHTMIRTPNAPALERRLHVQLSDYRVNRLNERKEFFCLSIEKLEAIIKKQVPHVEFRAAKHSPEWKASKRWNGRRRAF